MIDTEQKMKKNVKFSADNKLKKVKTCMVFITILKIKFIINI